MKNPGRMLASLAIIVVALFAVAASSSDKDEANDDSSGASNGSGAGEGDEVDDVAVDSCQPDSAVPSILKAGLTVTNNSSKLSNYLITISFETPDGTVKYGSGNAAVQTLGTGQTTTVEAIGSGNVSGELVCKVTEVERFAA